MKTKAREAPGESPERFAALAAAVHPDWHEAILRLGNAITGVSCQIDQIRECKDAGPTFVKRCQSLVDNLIDVLDAIGGDPDLEETDPREDSGDDEPALGSHEIGPGGVVSYLYHPICTWSETYSDGEQDGSDREPSLGSLNHDDQTRWGYSDRRDLEEQCEDEGER